MGGWAVRDGVAYGSGDPGFREASLANYRDMMRSASASAERRHRERMTSDAAYRARQGVYAAEYDRVFGAGA